LRCGRGESDARAVIESDSGASGRQVMAGFCVEPLDATPVLIGELGRAICLDEKHHGHITARVRLVSRGLRGFDGPLLTGAGVDMDTREWWVSDKN
jgi:hypothetical protein